jgi:hypothetical protein
LNFLRSQGFLPEVDPEDGNITFKYQMANFVFINNDDDEEFFQLLMPTIFEVTDDNREIVYEAVNKINMSIKVIKACIIDNAVWLFFENILDQSPEVEVVIIRALQILYAARHEFYLEVS